MSRIISRPSLALIFILALGTSTVLAADAALEQAIEQLSDAAQRNDAAAMARIYFAQDSKDDRLALANAHRIILAHALEIALTQHVSKDYGKSLVEQFGLINEALDLPMVALVHDNGDTAVVSGSGPDAPSAWFKKVNGVWKMDITPEKPATIADRAQDIEDDNTAVERITADVNAGKLKTLPQVRDALGNARLSAEPNGAFAMNDTRLEGEPLPSPGRDRPDPNGVFPSNPTTPAGATNRFVTAIDKGDEPTLCDSLFMPEDHDGSCRAAAAHDYVVGLKFLQAAEAKFSDRNNSNRVAFWLGALQRSSLRGYTDDEWRIEPGYPDLAMSSWETISTTDTTADGQQVPVHAMTGVPIMHHCTDGKWRIGPRFPQNARQVHARAAQLAAKDAILQQAATDLRAGKYATDAAVIQAVMPQLQQIGSRWGLAGYANSQ